MLLQFLLPILFILLPILVQYFRLVGVLSIIKASDKFFISWRVLNIKETSKSILLSITVPIRIKYIALIIILFVKQRLEHRLGYYIFHFTIIYNDALNKLAFILYRGLLLVLLASTVLKWPFERDSPTNKGKKKRKTSLSKHN